MSHQNHSFIQFCQFPKPKQGCHYCTIFDYLLLSKLYHCRENCILMKAPLWNVPRHTLTHYLFSWPPITKGYWLRKKKALRLHKSFSVDPGLLKTLFFQDPSQLPCLEVKQLLIVCFHSPTMGTALWVALT